MFHYLHEKTFIIGDQFWSNHYPHLPVVFTDKNSEMNPLTVAKYDHIGNQSMDSLPNARHIDINIAFIIVLMPQKPSNNNKFLLSNLYSVFSRKWEERWKKCAYFYILG